MQCSSIRSLLNPNETYQNHIVTKKPYEFATSQPLLERDLAPASSIKASAGNVATAKRGIHISQAAWIPPCDRTQPISSTAARMQRVCFLFFLREREISPPKGISAHVTSTSKSVIPPVRSPQPPVTSVQTPKAGRETSSELSPPERLPWRRATPVLSQFWTVRTQGGRVLRPAARKRIPPS